MENRCIWRATFPMTSATRVYASALLGNRNHWVRQLPGQLLHNIISHGIAKLAEFLDDDLTEIVGDCTSKRATQEPRREQKSWTN